MTPTFIDRVDYPHQVCKGDLLAQDGQWRRVENVHSGYVAFSDGTTAAHEREFIQGTPRIPAPFVPSLSSRASKVSSYSDLAAGDLVAFQGKWRKVKQVDHDFVEFEDGYAMSGGFFTESFRIAAPDNYLEIL